MLTLVIAVALANQSLAHWLTPQGQGVNAAPANSAFFTTIDNEAALNQALASSDKPVILDFYADWCVSCKVWERDIWHNPAFGADLSRFTLLKVDVTDFNDEHQALFHRLHVVAPPTVLIYGAKSSAEMPQSTIVGEMNAADFAAELQKWH